MVKIMVDVLAIGSHPDDLEFGCGGILAKLAAEKKSIVMADLTLGDKGTFGSPEVRKREAEAAAQLIGAERVFLDFKDCEIEDNKEGRLQLVRLIREVKPKLVLAPMWQGVQNHPDHIATGKLARAACRFARFSSLLPELPIHWIEGILHYPPFTDETIDFLIDVSDVLEVWKGMMRCHESQMKRFPYDDWNLRNASRLGVLINRPYAQGLVKGNPIVIDDLMSISKGTREL